MGGKRNPVRAVLHGAFEAWLTEHREGEELHLCEELEAVCVQVSTPDAAEETRLLKDEIGKKAPRQAGVEALLECLKVVRNPGGPTREVESLTDT